MIWQSRAGRVAVCGASPTGNLSPAPPPLPGPTRCPQAECAGVHAPEELSLHSSHRGSPGIWGGQFFLVWWPVLLTLGPVHPSVRNSGSNVRFPEQFKAAMKEMPQARMCAPEVSSQMGPFPAWRSSQPLGRTRRHTRALLWGERQHREHQGQSNPVEDGEAPRRR